MNPLYKGICLLIPTIMVAFTGNADQLEQKIFDSAESYFYTIARNEEFPWGNVATITQDTEGFMWFGTQKGAYRYDGYEFQKFSHSANDPKSLSGDFVDYSFSSNSGTTILANNNGFSIFDPENNNFLNYSSKLEGDQNIPTDYVTNFTETERGIWGGTKNHIIRLEENVKKPVIYPIATITEDNQTLKIRTIASDHKNQIWITTDKGLYFSPDDDLNFRNYDKSWQPGVKRFHLDSSNRLWLLTDSQELHYIDSNGQRHKFQGVPAERSNKSGVRTILDTGGGEIWIQFTSREIRVFASDTLRYIREIKSNIYNKNSIADDEILSLFKDNTGLLWLGYQSSGIQIHNPKNKFSRQIHTRTKNQNENREFYNVIVSNDQKIWVGQYSIYMLDLAVSDQFIEQHHIIKGINTLLGLNSSNDKKTSNFKIDDGPKNSLILAPDSENLFQYDISTSQLTKLNLDNDSSDSTRIAKLQYLENNKVWITDFAFTVTTYNLATNVVRTFKLDKNKGGRTLNLFLDSRDTVWFPTTSGLYYVNNSSAGSELTAQLYEPLNDTLITSVIEDHSNTLWVDTSIGLHRIDLNNPAALPENISKHLQQPSEQLFGNMYVDQQNRIWSDEGFLDTEKLELHRFLKNDGVPYGTNWLGSIDSTENGLVILAHQNYLHLIWPDRYTDNSSTLKLGKLNGFIDEQPFPLAAQSYQLEARPKRIHFNFSAQEYRNPMAVSYAYKLTPYDDTWNEANIATRSANYRQLPPGDYTLNVRATMNSDTATTTMSSVQFTIAKAWYQTTWFYGFLLVLALTSIWLLVMWRTARLRLNQKRLSALVFERTEQLETSLLDLREMQGRLVQSEKQASLGRIVRGVAHELNTPIGVLKMATSMSSDAATEVIKLAQHHAFTSEEAKLKDKKNKSTNDLIEKNLVRLTNLVNSFKSISPDDNCEPLKEIELHDYLKLLNKQFPNQKITITGEAGFKVTTYQSALNRVITELIDNSVKHNQDSQNQSNLEIAISYGRDDFFPINPYWICVKDNGVGMEAEAMEKAFDPFYTTVKDSSSTGLGLHMVFNNVTHQMDGEIDYESTVGHEASFTIRLPEKRQTTETLADRASSPNGKISGAT